MNFSDEFLEKIRSVDILTYFQQTAPSELVPLGRHSFCLRHHDSLKISNGKWFWHSRGFGAASALDYLIKVENMSFINAVNSINDITPRNFIHKESAYQDNSKPDFKLPEKYCNNKRVTTYLASRGVDYEIINHCIKHNLLFEDRDHHNAIFIGKDPSGNAAYAFARSTLSNSNFKIELSGSDKRYSFHFGEPETGNFNIFESCIDALSYASLEKISGRNWKLNSYLSLGGIGVVKKEYDGSSSPSPSQTNGLPLALEEYLSRFTVNYINICFDNDSPGKLAAKSLSETLSLLRVNHSVHCPENEKDYSDMLKSIIIKKKSAELSMI